MRLAWRPAAPLLAFLLLCGPAGAQEAVPGFEEIVAHMGRVNASLYSFIVNQFIDLRVLGIPVRLHSTIYAARPANYKIVFHNLPRFLNRAGDAFSKASRPEHLLKDYQPTSAAAVMDGERRVYHLVLRGRRPDVNPPSGELWVDAQTWIVPKMVLNYEWGAVMATYNFVDLEGYLMPGVITVSIPRYRATARLTFQDYRLNVPLPDNIFGPSPPGPGRNTDTRPPGARVPGEGAQR